MIFPLDPFIPWLLHSIFFRFQQVRPVFENHLSFSFILHPLLASRFNTFDRTLYTPFLDTIMTPTVPPEVAYDVQNIHSALESTVPDQQALVNIIGKDFLIPFPGDVHFFSAFCIHDFPVN